jgi:ketosteroid isomerase-like protein
MKAVAALCVFFSAWAAIGSGQEPVKPSGEEGRIVALESAWDQAEQNKDAAALAGLLADNLVYVDYDGSVSNKQQFLESIKSSDITSEQINNEGVAVRLYGNNSVAVSMGIYRDKGVEKGKPFQRRGRFTNVWIKHSGEWQCVASQSTLIVH